MAGRSIVLFAALGAALVLAGAAWARPFEGTVGPGPTITLKRASGADLTHASPGYHRFAISDQASGHNFHLFGPGVSKKTGIAFIGSRTWRVKLSVGTYTFRCDAHPTTMRGTFNVS